jgi:hypothetical protein
MTISSERNHFCWGTQIQYHAFGVQNTEVRVALEQQIRERFQEDGDVVEELLGKTSRGMF